MGTGCQSAELFSDLENAVKAKKFSEYHDICNSAVASGSCDGSSL